MLPEHLYIHVPFCARRCIYCDFAVEATRTPPTGEWVWAVSREMRLLAEEQDWGAPLPLDTIYLGGGTPSVLAPGDLAALAEELRDMVVWDPATVEWTCEANPESFTPRLARAWREIGVNRISLGAQTFHEPSLRWMGRLHGPEGPSRAMKIARDAGFARVSIDLIFGLPARLGRSWEADLDRALALEPDHISLYGLTAEEGAPLGRRVAEGRERMPVEGRYAREYLRAHERLTAAGFEHYEVSNFARPGEASRHNRAYWTNRSYVGLGPGAHGYLPPLRRWNTRDWHAYRNRLQAGSLPVDGSERVGPEEAAVEEVWLTLRTAEGRAWTSSSSTENELGRRWIDLGWAVETEAGFRLSAEGWLRLDALAVEMARAAEQETVGARRG